MDRKLTLIGGLLWIAGIAATIIGLNVEGSTGTWLTVGGNISFLLGLGLMGITWVRKKKTAEESSAAEKTKQD